MNYLSVCDGIGAAHVAWKSLGWKCIGASEIERFPIEVVKHRHPEIAELGDMTRYHEWNIEAPDLVCGGTPCQSFSVAGLRKGLADPRGNLALVFLGIVDHFRPKWVVWENVPGVLSSGERRDFGAFLGGLGELGYGFAHRVLDAQYFGLAQRRKRVFVVGHLGSWQCAAAVLFERHGLQGYPAPSRRKGERTAPTISACPTGGGGLGTDAECDGGLIQSWTIAGNAIGRGDNSGPQRGDISEGVAHSMTTADRHAVVAPVLVRMREGKEGGGKGPLVSEDQSLTLATGNDQVLAYGDTAGTLRAQQGSGFRSNGTPVEGLAFHGMQVRRLTPGECEKLQGFSPGYTNIPWRGKSEAPDGPRYKALGNSWAVPVVGWIGQRIEMVDAITNINEVAA